MKRKQIGSGRRDRDRRAPFCAAVIAMVLLAATCSTDNTDSAGTPAGVTGESEAVSGEDAADDTGSGEGDGVDLAAGATGDDTGSGEGDGAGGGADLAAGATGEDTGSGTVQAASEWEMVAGGEDCICADGSDFSYWIREADPTKVVFYLEGGGVCFNAVTCSFTTGNYTPSTGVEDDPTGVGGIFDFDNPGNPLADYSFVAVPYCTGDIHIGNASSEYTTAEGEEQLVHHRGYINATTALADMAARFSDAVEVVVAGSSAGSAGAPLYGGLASDLFPDASVTVVSDSSGAYQSSSLLNVAVGSLWGTTKAMPAWPVNDGLTMADWGLLELYIQASRHAPRIRFSRFNHAFDERQVFFASLAGIDAANIDQLIKQNEAYLEEAGVNVMNYTAPGSGHTILDSDDLYALEVGGVAFLDWFTAVIAGDEAGDVVCQDCAQSI